MPLNLVLRQIPQAIPRLTPGTTPQKFREEFNNAIPLIAKNSQHATEDIAIPGRDCPRPGSTGRALEAGCHPWSTTTAEAPS